ncbi:hypothetical protein ACW0US_17605 [Xanthomonas euvesicatoria]
MRSDTNASDEVVPQSDSNRRNSITVIGGTYALFLAGLAWTFTSDHAPAWVVGILAIIASGALVGAIANKRMDHVAAVLWSGFLILAAAFAITHAGDIFAGSSASASTSGISGSLTRSFAVMKSWSSQALVYGAGAIYLYAAVVAWRPSSVVQDEEKSE